MKINSNITAYLTNNAYMQNEMRLSNSTGRLSSGYKLNTAGDDPANFAIAAKLRSMIKGLDKVKTNTTTGMSVLETAESAIMETQEMVQRMNELAIKGANGTLSSADRQLIQDEVEQLMKEIDRIAETTEFNGMKLLNGTFNDRGYTSDPSVTVMDYSEKTASGKYYIDLQKSGDTYVIKDAPQTKIDDNPGYKNARDLFAVDPTKLTISTETVNYDDGTSVDFVSIKGLRGTELRLKAEEPKEYNGTSTLILADGSKLYNESVTYNSKFNAGSYNFSDLGLSNSGGTYTIGNTSLTNELFGSHVETKDNGDGTVTISGSNGATLTLPNKFFGVDSEMAFGATITINEAATTKTLELDLTGLGSMRLQVGTEQGEVISASIPRMTTDVMGLAGVDMRTKGGSQKAIDQVGNALEYVNRARSRLGAYENRLEKTDEFLDAYNESVTTSVSRIQDTDMAEEMTEFTSMQVLSQAGISMLAQANEAPQQALQLLQ
ncbi:MAG: hypothetical protein J6O70_06730 [Lachnospiraceae bacterium]|nr:hypothetical protein [Lachnospiraceae bacterium]